jgi:hypothetical protein
MPETRGRIRSLHVLYVPYATSGRPAGAIALRGGRRSQDDGDDVGSVYVRDAPLDAEVTWRRRGWLATVDLDP